MFYRIFVVTLITAVSSSAFAQESCSTKYESAARKEPGGWAKFGALLIGNMLAGNNEDKVVTHNDVGLGSSYKRSLTILKQAEAAKRDGSQIAKGSELEKFIKKVLKDNERAANQGRIVELLARGYENSDAQSSACLQGALSDKELKKWVKSRISLQVASESGAKVSSSSSKSSADTASAKVSKAASSGGSAN